MLNFYNSRIRFNCEIGTGEEYLITESNFVSKENLELFLPRCKLINKLSTKEMKESPNNYCLSIEQFKYFIEKWKSHFPHLKSLLKGDWFSSYKNSILLYGNLVKEHTRDQLFNSEMCYQIIKKEKTEESFLIDFNTDDFMPEISWCIEDCFWHLLNGSYSNYTDYVNNFIRKNIERIEFQKEVNNILFSGNFPINYCSIDFKDFYSTDWENPSSLILLNPPFCEERVRTNVLRIKELINLVGRK